MPDIMHLVRIAAPAERVYEALASAEGIREWWTRDLDWQSTVGGQGELRFYDGAVRTRVTVEELVPAARVRLRVLDGGNAPGGWDGTTITFDLRAGGTDTVLTLKHAGFSRESEGFALVSTGWAYYMVSLQQYLETGRGTPQQDKDLARVLTGRDEAADIAHSVDIDAAPDQVYDALTTQTGLAGWWTPATTAEPREGAVNEFRFGPGTTLAFRVDALIPQRRVAWSAVRVPPEWVNTRITFDLTRRGGSVTLRFRQSGLPAVYARRDTFNYLWAQYLRSLKRLVEIGSGEPFGSPASVAAGTTPRPAAVAG